ncbi:efa4c77c-919c-4331-8a7c-1013580c39dc [Thermothielavioides terrestris]|uniref:Efa4c77c-919c-4331-8a7c-1013580c39dc n=1 Tax=Thermothielavioides terrestris TaxID=2587410 RepID=A0A3S4BH90_9PEZI|nr:efa4c77c-919c-4331-8a7c-1013580c39dc [Thermothielavioides terrestris]
MGPEKPARAGAEPGQASEGIPEDQEIDFVTLGMFIIDEIEFPPPKPPVRDILGGAGSYSALGARLFSPPPLSRTVGWIVDQGSDFPPSITAQINTWQTSALFRRDPSRLTTRGWNGYAPGSEQRAFRYTTPKKRLTAADLTPPLLRAKAIHLICSPLRCRELITDILARRREAYLASDPTGEAYTRPLFIWEPVPDRCVPAELLNCTNTLPLVDVCSPNHAELAGFMGAAEEEEAGDDVAAAVERHCEQLLASMPLASYTLVVRAGAKGCFVARNGGRKKKTGGSSSRPKRRKREYVHGGLRPDTDMEALFAGLLQDEEGRIAREEIEIDPGLEKWVPAYYGDGYNKSRDGGGDAAREKVVDPTGGGNTFLGGLAVALARGKSIEEACVWGHVAASFAIEQVGFPVLSVDEEGRETWNGVRVEDRLREFQERL